MGTSTLLRAAAVTALAAVAGSGPLLPAIAADAPRTPVIAVVRSSRRVYMIGVAIGQTSIFFFDAEGHQIAGFDIAVTRDLNGLRGALQQAMPDADIRVEGIGD